MWREEKIFASEKPRYLMSDVVDERIAKRETKLNKTRENEN